MDEQILVRNLTFILGLSALSFILSMMITPIFTYFAYKNRWWKKVKSNALIGGGKEKAPVFYKLHKEKHKRNIPTMAGVIIWGTVALVTLAFNLSREQTYLPLFSLVAVGCLGIIDDYINIKGIGGGVAGIKAKVKMSWLILIAVFGAWWFYYKLGWNFIHIPAVGNFEIGLWYVPLFILVLISAANAVNITDGLDGLSGGLLIESYGAFAVIAFFQGNYGIAAFCGTIIGALLTYTWFNIYPARFFMGDTGAVALGATLGVIAMLTNAALILPVIGFVFVVETLSDIVQMFSKNFFKRKVFLSTPIHHHFEAIGWPETKVTMRFWVIGAVMATIGLVIGLLGKG